MKRRILGIILALSLCFCCSAVASAATNTKMLDEITINFDKSGQNYKMTFTNVADWVETTATGDSTELHRIYYYPGATVTVSGSPDNSVDFTNGFFLEANYHFGSKGKVKANTRYSIEEVFSEFYHIIDPNGETSIEDTTGVLGLCHIFLTPCSADGFEIANTDNMQSIYAYEADSSNNNVSSSWAAEQVNTAIAANLVPAYLQSKYTQAITRVEFCALAVALYENVKGEITERKLFTDTSDINVEKAAAIGVVSGMNAEGTLFSPNTQLTREQAATMLSRLADAADAALPNQPTTFNDAADISPWAADAVGQMQVNGIMSGVGNNTFAPKNPYTREQSISTVLRLWELIYTPQPEVKFDWVDMDTTYEGILRPYAESLGFECEYSIWNSTIFENEEYYYLHFTKGNLRVTVHPLPSSEIYSYLIGTPDDNNGTSRIEDGATRESYVTTEELKEALKAVSQS